MFAKWWVFPFNGKTIEFLGLLIHQILKFFYPKFQHVAKNKEGC
jgi:hypothetical protein